MSGLFIQEHGDEAIRAELVDSEEQPIRMHQSSRANSPVITDVSGADALIVLSRNPDSTWLKVIYLDQDHDALVGWLPVEAIERITFREMEVDLDELPINQHTSNRIEEVAARTAELQSQMWRSLLPYSWIWLGLSGLVGVIFYLLALNDIGSGYTAGAVIQGIAFGLAGGGFTYIVAQILADRELRDEITELHESLDVKRGSRLLVDDVNLARGAAVYHLEERRRQRHPAQ